MDISVHVGPYFLCNCPTWMGKIDIPGLHEGLGRSLREWKDENKVHLYIPNHRWYDPDYCKVFRRFSFDAKEKGFALAITAERVQMEQDAIAELYAKEQKILEAKYGVENVSIQWGIINEIY